MADIIATFDGGMPEAYEKYLVPFMFGPCADDFTARAAALNPSKILEIACGTGIVTRRLRAALPDAALTATDLSDDMITAARGVMADLDGIDYRQADGCDLPFEDAGFDMVAVQFGTMFYPDKVGGYREALRVLEPGGTLLFNVWDTLEANAMAGLAHQVIGGFFDSDPPQFLKTPFGYNDVDVVTGHLTEAGFGAVDHAVVRLDAQSQTARDLAYGFIHGNPNIAEIRARGTAEPEKVVDAVAEAFAAEAGDNPLKTSIQCIVFSATKG